MAALHLASGGSFRNQFTDKTCRDCITCLSSSFHARPTGRRNYLRKKILKTLKEPVFPKHPVVEPIDHFNSPPVDEIVEFDAIEEMGESEKSESVSEALSVEKSIEGDVPWLNPGLRTGMLSGENSLLKYGVWLVGAYVFQTMFAILFVQRNQGNDRDSANDVGVKGEGQSTIEIAVKEMGLSDLEMEQKIEEIRIMAREARVKERMERGSFDSEDREEDEVKFNRSVIEEEVNNRMVMLRKKLENARTHIPSSWNTESFVQKYKSRGRYMANAMGFTGSEYRKVPKSQKNGNDSVAEGNEEKLQEVIDPVNSEEGKTMMQSTKNSRKKVKKESEPSKGGKGDYAVKSKVINGIDVRLDPEAVYSRTRESAVDPNVLLGPSDLKTRDFGGSESAVLGREFWWLKLPYVLVIHMRKGLDNEGVEEGLYTLKPLANTEEDQISHMVAFEDRADATNYCYLMQSFFEELNEFKVEVVPLPVKELNEAVKSGAVNVLVVKKGTLDLYAGQPLANAEMALRALNEQA